MSFHWGVDVRSSWIVENGFARPLGTVELAPGQRGYHCSGCGEKGHSTRTCGREPSRR